MTTSFYEFWKLGQLVELTEYVIKWNVKMINQLRVFFLSLPRSDGSKTSSASHLQTTPTSLSGNVSNILSYLSNAFSKMYYLTYQMHFWTYLTAFSKISYVSNAISKISYVSKACSKMYLTYQTHFQTYQTLLQMTVIFKVSLKKRKQESVIS